SYQTSKLHDKSKLRTFNNLLSLNYQNKIIGKASFLANFYKYNYLFNSIVVGPQGTITNQLKDNEIALGGRWEKNIGRFSLKGSLIRKIVAEMGGTQSNAQMKYSLTDAIQPDASSHASTRTANMNFLLYQSDYQGYNWQHTDDFEKQNLSST